MKQIISSLVLSILLMSHLSALTYGPNDPEWRVVNDTVMGGISSSSARPLDDGLVRFSGNLSLENNGGFASIRAASRDFAFPGNGEVILNVRGDGRTYFLDLRMDRRRGGFSYRQAFPTVAGEISEARLPLSGFQATAFGRRVTTAGPLEPGAVVSIGFMLSDKNPGSFQLDVISMEFEASERTSISSPVELIDLAIARGVPLFNRGDMDACASVYEAVVHSLLMMPESVVPKSVKESLMAGLDALQVSTSHFDRAWALRHALDRARALL